MVVTATGGGSLAEFCALADFPAAVAKRKACKRALFDLLALSPLLSTAEHRELGSHMARTLREFERVAVVLSRFEYMVAAAVAGEYGLTVECFSTLADANEWLVSPASATQQCTIAKGQSSSLSVITRG